MLLTTALLLGSAITAGISAVGGLIGSAADEAHQVANREDNQAFNAQEAEIQRQWQSQEAVNARAFNAQEAQKQRDFEKYMSDTSYQRARADMELAGYNPASLGISQGASTPSGAVASGSPLGSTAAAQSNISNTSRMDLGSKYFSNLFQSALMYNLNKDKNLRSDIVEKMFQTNASDMKKIASAIVAGR